MAILGILKEVLSYFSSHKRRWLLPIILFLLILGILLVASTQTVFAPFLYTIF